MRDEEKASGISPEPTELDEAVEEIMELEEAAEVEQQASDGAKKEKEETDRQKAENMRKKAMEKLGETQKRSAEEGEQTGQRKKRRNGSETLLFLREKADRERVFKEEELAFRQRQQELEVKKHEAFVTQQSAIQAQHKEMLQLMQEANNQQQQQAQNAQMMMMQLQQQQTQGMMSLLEKLANKPS